jgi:hypothetical protein
MTWEALSALAGAGGVLVLLVVHVVGYAYQRGRTDHRLDALEKGQGDTTAVGSLLSALTATVQALRDSVERLDGAVVEIRRQIYQPRDS